MSIIVTLHKAFLKPTMAQAVGGLNIGDPNPLYNHLIEAGWKGWTFNIQRGQTNFTITLPPDDDGQLLSPAIVRQICGTNAGQLSQEINGYAAWIKVPAAVINTNVPLWLLKPYVLDADGLPTATRHTWATWAVNPRAGTGVTYIELNSGGALEPGSTIARLANLIVTTPITGAAIMTADEVIEELG